MNADSNWLSETSAKIEAKATSLLDRIPGYRGYRDKEGRRDADRLVRDSVSAALERQAVRVDAVARTLADRRRIADVGPVGDLATAIRHLADRIRTASYGYAPLFSDRVIDERALDQLRLFDDGLLAATVELDPPIQALEAALAANGDLRPPLQVATGVVLSAGERFALRNEVLSSGEAASEESVVAVLSTEPPPMPHPAYSLNSGDAVSILGDDYVVDARINLSTGDQSARLFRLQAGPPGRWLFVPMDGKSFCADMPESDSANDAVPWPEVTEATGTGEISGTAEASGSRPVRVRVRSDGVDLGARELRLDWGTERQDFSGRSVHPDDIEVFGASTGR